MIKNYNFLKFLEEKRGLKIPINIKLLNNIKLTKEELTINGDLDLGGSKIHHLPDNLIVYGDLNLRWSEIETIGENTDIDGDLNLSYTSRIKKLPKGLQVGGTLILRGSMAEELPEDIIIGGHINLYGIKSDFKVSDSLKERISFNNNS